MTYNLVRYGGALMLSALTVTPATAAIVLTTGTGSAVSTVDSSANFVPVNSLTDDPYVEGGISFSRTNLTFNNNGCGYAGCASHIGFTGFSGNYMYGTGVDGYFDIKSSGSNIFSGLEFVIGTGYARTVQEVSWRAFLNNVLVGSGSTSLAVGSVVGFSGAGGFDTLRYTSGPEELKAPAFDSVRAQFSPAGAVPEPAAWLMMILGFAFVGAAMRRGKPQVKVSYNFA